MPESNVRKVAADKRKKSDREQLASKKRERNRLTGGDRTWVPYTFVPALIIGVLWLVVYYIIGDFFPGIHGNWNILVGMGLMAASFMLATLWK